MKLYHTTLKANLESIHENGIDPSFARDAEKVIFLHTRSRTEWAILHIALRYSVSLEDITVIEVNVPRSVLRRDNRGLWTTTEIITTCGSITDAEVFAESPIKN